MAAREINGMDIQASILVRLRETIDRIRTSGGQVPGLAVIGVEDQPINRFNVRLHASKARSVGMEVFPHLFPAEVSEADLLAVVDRCNDDDRIHGIIIFNPLPEGLDDRKIMQAVAPVKDVEGFHPQNVMKMIAGEQAVRLPAVIPSAILACLEWAGVSLERREVVLAGAPETARSSIAEALLQLAPLSIVRRFGEQAPAVTVLYRDHPQLADHCRRADVLIVATRSPGLINGDWIKPGACVIDLGANYMGEAVSPKDTTRTIPVMQGDVDGESVRHVAGVFAPVPGGAAPVVLAMLLRNTLLAQQIQRTAADAVPEAATASLA